MYDINEKLNSSLIDKSKLHDMDDRLKNLETTVNRYIVPVVN